MRAEGVGSISLPRCICAWAFSRCRCTWTEGRTKPVAGTLIRARAGNGAVTLGEGRGDGKGEDEGGSDGRGGSDGGGGEVGW